MNDMTRNVILDAAKTLAGNYETQNIMDTSLKANLPDRQVVYSILEDLHKISFP